MRHKHLSTLPRLSRLECFPTIHGAHFHTDHSLITILGLKISHTLGFFHPRIPHDAVFDAAVARHVERGFPVFYDGGGGLFDGFVDTIDFSRDGEIGRGLLVFGGVEDFVDVGDAAEAGDLSFGNVLENS